MQNPASLHNNSSNFLANDDDAAEDTRSFSPSRITRKRHNVDDDKPMGTPHQLPRRSSRHQRRQTAIMDENTSTAADFAYEEYKKKTAGTEVDNDHPDQDHDDNVLMPQRGKSVTRRTLSPVSASVVTAEEDSPNPK